MQTKGATATHKNDDGREGEGVGGGGCRIFSDSQKWLTFATPGGAGAPTGPINTFTHRIRSQLSVEYIWESVHNCPRKYFEYFCRCLSAKLGPFVHSCQLWESEGSSIKNVYCDFTKRIFLPKKSSDLSTICNNDEIDLKGQSHEKVRKIMT
jgi:hypothetical protein